MRPPSTVGMCSGSVLNALFTTDHPSVCCPPALTPLRMHRPLWCVDARWIQGSSYVGRGCKSTCVLILVQEVGTSQPLSGRCGGAGSDAGMQDQMQGCRVNPSHSQGYVECSGVGSVWKLSANQARPPPSAPRADSRGLKSGVGLLAGL